MGLIVVTAPSTSRTPAMAVISFVELFQHLALQPRTLIQTNTVITTETAAATATTATTTTTTTNTLLRPLGRANLWT